MPNSPKVLLQWPNDDDLHDYLIGTLRLPNADAIVRKVTLEGPVTFSNGTRQLAYAKGSYYLYQLEPEPDYGTGKRLEAAALQARWQAMAPNIKVECSLAATGYRLAIHEWERGGVAGITIVLNTTKLKGNRQVAQAIAEVDRVFKE